MASATDIGYFSDWVAIRQLSARCNAAFDRGDGEGYASSYTEDGTFVVDGEPVAVGTDRLVDLVAKSKGFVHISTDAVIEVSGDRATQDCNFLLFRRSRDLKSVELKTTGRYHDDLLRTTDGWRFASRAATLHADF